MAEGQRAAALTHFGIRHLTADRRGRGTSPQTCGRQHLKHGKGGKGGPHSDFLSTGPGQRGFRAAFSPSCILRDPGDVTTFTAQARSPEPWAVCLQADEEGGIREIAGGGGSAAELIKSFEGDGELSQVHIKGQGNEC